MALKLLAGFKASESKLGHGRVLMAVWQLLYGLPPYHAAEAKIMMAASYSFVVDTDTT